MAADQAQSSEPSILDRLLGPMPRWLVYLLVPGFLSPVLILGFIFVSELAHDEARCPYARQSEQRVSDGIRVREDGRICLPGIEERRFTVMRAKEEHVLGRRRFSSGSFEPERYRWRAELSDKGEVRVTVDNDGHAQAVFREGTADERAP